MTTIISKEVEYAVKLDGMDKKMERESKKWSNI
jgi:hypothetical protein